MTDTGITLAPTQVDPELDGDHERMSHIVLEGFKPKGDYVAAGPTVVEDLEPVRGEGAVRQIWVRGAIRRSIPTLPDVQGDRGVPRVEGPRRLHPRRLGPPALRRSGAQGSSPTPRTAR